MKRILRALAVVCLLTAGLFGQSTTVSATLNSLTGTPITSGAYMQFTLKAFNGNPVRVVGANWVDTKAIVVRPDGNGLISTPLQGNDTLTSYGINDTYYLVEVYDNGTKIYGAPFKIVGVSFNLNTQPPLSGTPPSGMQPTWFLPLTGGTVTGLLNVIGTLDVNGSPTCTTTNCPGQANETVTFTNATSASLTTSYAANNLVWACYDNAIPSNEIEPGNVTLNPSTLVMTFSFLVPQTGYCAINGTGGSGGGVGGGNFYVDLVSGQTVGGNKRWTGLQTAGFVNGVCIVDGIVNPTLAAAVACAGVSGVVEIPMLYVAPMTASVTIPVGVTLRFDGPSCITTTGYTLTINGPLVAPVAQIFCGTGTIAGLDFVRPDWFPGAELGAQVNAAMAALSSGGTVLIAPGTYPVTTLIYVTKSGIKIQGSGQGNTILTQNLNNDLIQVSLANNFELSGFTFNDTGTSSGYNMVELDYSSYAKIHDNHFTSSRTAAANTLNGVRIAGASTHLANYNEVYHNTFSGIPWIAMSAAANANGNSFTDNKVFNGGEPFDINGDAVAITGTQIIGNYFYGGNQSAYLQSVDGSQVSGNQFMFVGSTTQPSLTLLLASGSSQAQTIISGNLFQGSGSQFHCISMHDNVRDTIIDANDFESCGGDGINTANGAGALTNISITNNIFHNSGVQNASAGFAAIHMYFTPDNGYGAFHILNNHAYDDQGGAASQTYGLTLNCTGAGTLFNSEISGNDFSSNKTGSFSFGACVTATAFGYNNESGGWVDRTTSGGVKRQISRVVGCATAASLNATCDQAITWAFAFSDVNYTVSCTSQGVISGVPALEGTDFSTARTGAAITVRTISLTAAAAEFSVLNCTAIHD